MRAASVLVVCSLAACGAAPIHHNGDNNDGRGSGSGGCTGLQCQVTDCAAQGKSDTTLTGTVFAPNGTLPLYGVSVYVPNSDPGAFMAGPSCTTCASGLPGDPIVSVRTDEMGKFTLSKVPDGADIPVVITIGKWRRQIKIAKVDACASQPIGAADTSLPKAHDDMTANTTRVDMPQIAISTGRADSLECLVRRLGIADKEIATGGGTGRIHLFSDNGSPGAGVASFDSGFAGGTGAFADSATLWGSTTDPGKLMSYDIVILSCEGGQNAGTKPQAALDHMKAYADNGGRVFLSHWHNIWVEGATQPGGNGQKPAVWPGIATFNNSNMGGPGTDTIDETNNPKGQSFATWMLNVGGSPVGMRDVINIDSTTGKNTCSSVVNTKAERWVYWSSGGQDMPQDFQFTTPNEMPADQRCGKVVFSDMHVSGGPLQGNYPTSCGTATDLSPQEKALSFMFFDIASCVGTVF
jgi:hypothetical protein